SIGTVCFSHEVDAVEYYTSKLNQYERSMEYWRAGKIHRGCGIVFVTFKTQDGKFYGLELLFRILSAALSFIADGRKGGLANIEPKWNSSSWKVEHAPDPRDILWRNLPIGASGRI